MMVATESRLKATEGNLKGKVAIVTGSTSGIGLGIAQALAAKGADVMLNGFGDAKEIERIRADLAAESKVKVVYDGADMSKPDAIEAMVKNAEKTFGKVDIVVNNAGIQFVSPIDEFPLAKWDAIIAINLSSAFHTTRAALPGMKARKWGRIVNIASAHGLVASAFKSAYVAAKHGVVGLTKTAALEYATDRIRVNCVNPGYITTPMTKETIEQRGDEIMARVPMNRMGVPEEIAEAVVWMCSDKASFMTGAAQVVDGGYYAA
jgi:3-hydroxybutyrate dehydrogenase